MTWIESVGVYANWTLIISCRTTSLIPPWMSSCRSLECKESELILRRTADNVVSAAQCWEGNLRTSCMVSKQLVSCTFPGIPAFHSEFILEKNQHRTPNSLGPGKIQKFTKGGRQMCFRHRKTWGEDTSDAHLLLSPSCRKKYSPKEVEVRWNKNTGIISHFYLSV